MSLENVERLLGEYAEWVPNAHRRDVRDAVRLLLEAGRLTVSDEPHLDRFLAARYAILGLDRALAGGEGAPTSAP